MSRVEEGGGGVAVCLSHASTTILDLASNDPIQQTLSTYITHHGSTCLIWVCGTGERPPMLLPIFPVSVLILENLGVLPLVGMK